MIALCLAGCGGEEQAAVYPVSGSVIVNGKPAEGASVVFHPRSPGGDLAEFRPSGKTDADGKFQLTTREANDGAPPGDYKITINWAKSDIKPGQPAEDARVIRLLPDEYFLADRTPLSATVKPASNDIAPFDIKTRK